VIVLCRQSSPDFTSLLVYLTKDVILLITTKAAASNTVVALLC